jgi:hypothetical protein
VSARDWRWHPASAAEYETLSIREKIREQRILAVEAGNKTGAMWKWDDDGIGMGRKGHSVAAVDMSENFHHWSSIRDGHLAEVARLQRSLGQTDNPFIRFP